MVRVIKKGFEDEVRCDSCGSQLQYELSDVYWGEKQAGEYDSEQQYCIHCPECKAKVNVTHLLSGAAQSQVDRRAREDELYS